LEAFELSIGDAVWMIELAEALDNQRKKRLYRQTRERLGEALRMPRGDWDSIDVVESDDFFIVIKPGADITRKSLEDRSALLRHAVVAACAATETYFADKITELVRPSLWSVNTATTPLPRNLREIPLTVGDMVDIDHSFEKRRRGLTETVVVPFIQLKASVDPTGLGQILALTPVKSFFTTVDRHLDWERGYCQTRMSAIAKRRNVIAHTGDRQGRGRNTLSIEETRDMTDDLTAIVHAAERILTPQPTPKRPDRSVEVHAALVTCSEPVTAADLAELCGAPRPTVATLLSRWSAADFNDDRFPGVVRISRGRYLFQP